MPRTAVEKRELLRLCCAEIEDVTIAFRADGIERFVEEVEDSFPPDLDLPAVLRLEADTSMTSRRRALIRTERGPLEVAVGARLSLKTVLARQIVPLPSLLDALAAQTGVAGVFEQEGRFAFLLDLHRVPVQESRVGPDELASSGKGAEPA